MCNRGANSRVGVGTLYEEEVRGFHSVALVTGNRHFVVELCDVLYSRSNFCE